MIILLILILLFPSFAQATTYYISPSGSNSNNGLTTGAPFLTFAYAINASRAWCGDTLLLRDGTYGDGTSTGRLDVNTVVCTLGDELTIRAENQRQAKVQTTDGVNKPCWIRNSAYIIMDGLFCRGAGDNLSAYPITEANPYQVRDSNHVTVRNNVFANPNRYTNSGGGSAFRSTDVLIEDNETYIFGRHCVSAWQSERVVVRRQYCNPRGGQLSGGYPGPGPGLGDALFSMYPCKDCIVENSIADGTTNAMYLNEMNATYGNNVLMSGSKVLGSICYNCRVNGIHINPRSTTDANHSPQNITVKDVVFYNHTGASSGIRISDCITCTLSHITMIGSSTADGASFDDTSLGVSGASQIGSIRNSTISGMDRAYNVASGSYTGGFTGEYLNANGNTTNFGSGTYTNTNTSDPGWGTCKGAWIPDASLLKGAGLAGVDMGATILYRYVDGVLTTTLLWDTTTGEFPHGAADPDGLNRVAGESLFDFHTRFNIDDGGCSFPAGYGSSGGGAASTVVKGTTAASALTGTTSLAPWNHTIAANQDLFLVCIGLHDAAGNVGSVSGVDVSGQAMTLVQRAVSTPAYRAAELWELASPTSGTRTITPTLTGTTSSTLGRSTEYDVTGGTQTPVGSGSTGAVATMSVTATTNENELVTDCTASSKNVTYTHGDNQTGETDLSHSTQALLLAVSHQNGSDGGVMSNATGGTVYQAKVAVSLDATPSDTPSTATLTQSDYLFVYPIGTEAGAVPVKSWLSDANAKNLPIVIHPNGLVRVRALIEGGVATTASFGAALFCRQNADSYVKVTNEAGANTFRLYGAGVTADIPSHLTPTTDRLCGSSCVAGAILRDHSTSFTVPALTVGQKIELDAVLQLVDASGTVDCRYQSDNGTVLDTYTNTPRMTIDHLAGGGM